MQDRHLIFYEWKSIAGIAHTALEADDGHWTGDFPKTEWQVILNEEAGIYECIQSR